MMFAHEFEIRNENKQVFAELYACASNYPRPDHVASLTAGTSASFASGLTLWCVLCADWNQKVGFI
jgi:hypothetical protein